MIRKYMHNWYYVGGIIFAVLAFTIGLIADQIDPMRRLMMVLYMCLLAHEFEEYAVPGGFPTAWNYGTCGEEEAADRYPLNVKSAFIVNVCCGYPVYILGIVFCDVHVLSVFICYLTMVQIMMHGFMMNIKMKTIYNPGVATAVLVMLPTGIYVLRYIASTFTVPAWTWWVPLCALPFAAFLMIALPIKLCQDKESPYPFPVRDTRGFAIRSRAARLWRDGE